MAISGNTQIGEEILGEKKRNDQLLPLTYSGSRAAKEVLAKRNKFVTYFASDAGKVQWQNNSIGHN
ncbi:hypothetical protein NQ314_016038 [Rhamnusium bicolor]|uniref:Uncharacterized protein n=1 Tax=Rhamnusium bicolor TaxID=1586634 RepID=A0AAV8WXW9_9CUCU|nr:hypothetical protein NQ314_016038 [Rhamnusium bicolor]